MTRRWSVGLLAAALLAGGTAGCGTTKIIIVDRPTHAVYDRLNPCPARLRRCSSRFDLRQLLGLTTARAASVARQRGLTLRVIYANGKSLLGDAEFDTARVDVETQDGIVTKLLQLG